MYLIKKTILKSFAAFVLILSRLSLAATVLILAAQGLAEMDHLERYALSNDLVLIVRHLLAPAVKFLHANLPLTVSGLDLAPYLIAVGFIVVWAFAEAERHRLRLLDWDLKEQRKVQLAEKALEKERRREAERRAELARVHERERARLAAEAAARAKAEARALEQARKAAQRAPAPAANAAPASAPAVPAPVAPAAAAPIAPVPAAPQTASHREHLLELYAQTKKSLEEQKKNLSFLAIDVVNSTGMKLGEDSALAERDFRQYKKLVERVIAAHKGLKAAWTPDGVMICFASVQNAVQAAQDLIRNLDHFNRQVKTIKADFKIRCGINAGRVLFDDTVPMEEMTDRNIDIAGHMQKYAEANTIYIGAHAIEGVRSQFGFRPVQKQVDGHDVYEWRADASADEAVAS